MSDSGSPRSSPPRRSDPEIYAIFCGNVDQPSVARITAGITTAINNHVRRLHFFGTPRRITTLEKPWLTKARMRVISSTASAAGSPTRTRATC